MKHATLRRTESGDQGTFGRLTVEGHPELEFHTGELPWRDNAGGVSCIPDGGYLVKWTFSNRFQRMMFQVMDVPDRTGIRIHAANLFGDEAKGLKAEVNGCIALGIKRTVLAAQEALGNSKKAVLRFEEALAGEDFRLTVRNSYLQPTS